jgi:hypothetical protein
MGRFDSIQQLKEAEKLLAPMFCSITIVSELIKVTKNTLNRVFF